MPPEHLRLKDGVAHRTASRALRDRIMDAGNITASGVGPNGALRLRDRYLEWVEATEAQLSNLSHDSGVLAMLQTTRYWRIRELDEKTVRPFPLVEGEIKVQTATLERLVVDLEQRAERLSAAPGHITVLDTNTLLEYQPPGEIPWLDVVGQPTVRLVVPLRVIEELDAKKYARRSDLADRARRVPRNSRQSSASREARVS